MPLLRAWLLAFAVTVVSELGVAVPVLAPAGSVPRRIATVCLAQLVTHPVVWFIWPLFAWPQPTYLLVAETFAFISEAMIYRFVLEPVRWSRAIAASALANGASIVAGIVLLR